MLPRDSGAMIRRRLDYRPPAFLVDTLDLAFDLDATATRVTAKLAFRRNPAAAPEDANAPLVLDGEQQKDVRVELDGRTLSAARLAVAECTLTVRDPPASGTLIVHSEIAPANNVALEGLYLSSGVFCTQCEAEGFRRITYFPDRPDVLTRYTVTIRADRARYPVLLSNGNLVASGENWAKFEDPYPKPSYLFALVAADLDACQQEGDDLVCTSSWRLWVKTRQAGPSIKLVFRVSTAPPTSTPTPQR